MAIIGFIFLVLIGLILVASSVILHIVNAGFSGGSRGGGIPGIVMFLIGAMILAFAFVNSPFSVTVK